LPDDVRVPCTAQRLLLRKAVEQHLRG